MESGNVYPQKNMFNAWASPEVRTQWLSWLGHSPHTNVIVAQGSTTMGCFLVFATLNLSRAKTFEKSRDLTRLPWVHKSSDRSNQGYNKKPLINKFRNEINGPGFSRKRNLWKSTSEHRKRKSGFWCHLVTSKTTFHHQLHLSHLS